MTADWKSQAETLLKAIWTPELDPLFWRSGRRGVESAWYGHVPFAHWLVRALAPRCIVELGSHNGVSYCAFCEAAQREGLGAQCLAIDTWTGDKQAGFYGEEVFAELRAYHDPRFGAFSTLLRRSFDDALETVAEGSVDLLHIDGQHGYDEVRHDFETWRGKMSERGVVLFHDTNVRDEGFGVWRYWSELQGEFPHFEFLHAHGLGVLVVGAACAPPITALTQLRDTLAVGAVRERFAQLGERCVLDAQVSLLGARSAERVREFDALRARLHEAETELATARSRLVEVRSVLAAADAAMVQARSEADASAARSQFEAARAQSGLAVADRAVADAGKQLREAAQDAAASRERMARAEAARIMAEEAASHAGWAQVEAACREHAHRDRATEALAGADAERAKAARAHAAATAAQTACRAEMERRAGAEAALNRILWSGTWRATRPLRTGLSWLPAMVRRPAFKTLQALWRMLTPHLNTLRRPLPAAVLPSAQPSAVVLPAIPVPSPLAQAPAAAFLVCYVSGEPDTPGTIYRVHRYAAACSAAGARVIVLRLDEVAAHMADAAELAILVIWRAVLTDALSAFIDAARANGARIVFDIDDLMIDPALATTGIIDGIRSQHFSEAAVQAHFALVQRTMFAADYCTSATPELAGHMRRFAKTSFVLPNGYDAQTLRTSRMAVRRRRAAPPDGVLRIGYASGSRTHQRDFAEVAPVLPNVLRRFPEARLVLFQAEENTKLLDLHEFPDLEAFASQIEWRDMVPLTRLPEEIARFDVNLAPLQLGNLFCEAKSELKYFEGALAGVPTIASPVGPYARVIKHGVNGCLAATPAQWDAALTQLLGDPALRWQMAQTALNDVLWAYGPERRAQLMRRVLAEWQGGASAADAFVLELEARARQPRPGPDVPAGEMVWSVDHFRPSEVTVVIPLHNYAHTVIETLDSVRAQTLPDLDLVIVDDGSTDPSLEVALGWVRASAGRFNRVAVLRNAANAGLAPTRNAAFCAAETPYVLPLDADNLLRPSCCEQLLAAVHGSGAAFAYPVIQEFGGRTGLMGATPYHPSRFAGGNYIDAMALVAKSAWSAVGGYAPMSGWEDYDFWCAIAEAGLHGHAMGGAPLADYRVHGASMLAQVTDTHAVKAQVIATIERRHPWVAVARPLEAEARVQPPAPATRPHDDVRRDAEAPLQCPTLRCPIGPESASA